MITVTDAEQIRNGLTKALREEPVCQWDSRRLGHFWVRSSGQNGVQHHGEYLTLECELGPVAGHFYNVWLIPEGQTLETQCDCPAGDKETPCYHIGQAVLDLRVRCKKKLERWLDLPNWLQDLDVRGFAEVERMKHEATGRKRTARFQAGPKAVPVRPKEERDGYEPDTQEEQFKAARRQEVA